MKISDLMSQSPEFCTINDTLYDVARVMASHDVGIVPICASQDTRQLIGCITDRDLVVRVIAEQKDVGSTAITDVMSARLVTCRPEDPAEHARELMEEHQIRRLMVIDEHGSLLGVVATADLARAVEEREVGETLEAISQPAPTLNIK
jgi:CBS domain-containing protein